MVAPSVRRPRLAAFAVLASYVATVIAVPVLHRLHHDRYGADHQHTAFGTIYGGLFEEAGAPLDEAAHHAAFDADLAALELSEVAHAGALSIDCEYSAFTLVACGESATPSHPHTFGDDLLARTHQHHAPAPFDPAHGAGSLEHLASSLLSTPTTIFPPPALPIERLALDVAFESHAAALRSTYAARAPPVTTWI